MLTNAVEADSESPDRQSPTAGTYARLTLGWLAFCAAIFVLGIVAVELAPRGSEVAAWWPAAGVAVAAATVVKRNRLLLVVGIVVFSGLANMSGGLPWPVSAGFAVSNAAEAIVAGWWLQRRNGHRPDLARSLELDVVAEGVETDEHARILHALGIPLGQGHLWYPALSPSDFDRLIDTSARLTLHAPQLPADAHCGAS